MRWTQIPSEKKSLMNMAESPSSQLVIRKISLTNGDQSLDVDSWATPNHSLVIAQQQIQDIDILADVQAAFDSFVSSGQVWALLIGLVLGYLVRSLTTY